MKLPRFKSAKCILPDSEFEMAFECYQASFGWELEGIMLRVPLFRFYYRDKAEENEPQVPIEDEVVIYSPYDFTPHLFKRAKFHLSDFFRLRKYKVNLCSTPK